MPLNKPEILPLFQVGEAITFINTLFGELDLKVEGEIANVNLSRGKFLFFDLKDEHEEARLSCFAMAYQLSSPLEEGMRVHVTGRPGLYRKNGQFRLSVLRVDPVGEGSLKRAFELLKLKLEKEGLFDQSRKRSLPRIPERVGIISSVEAAGYGDFMRIAEQRLPGVHFVVTHVAVQGVNAEREIIAAFDYLNSHEDLDIIVLIRGGGSIEDLHAFNSELVARAIVRSRTPVIVGVGHEKDITIADFCADVRAATPSNAAQILLPTKEEIVQEVKSDLLALSLQLTQRIANHQALVHTMLQGMFTDIQHSAIIAKERATSLLHTLAALSPHAVLARGFTITYGPGGKVIHKVNQVHRGIALKTQLSDGTISSKVI